MNPELIQKVYKILEAIPKTKANKDKIKEIEEMLENEEVEKAVYEIKKLQQMKDKIEENEDDEEIEEQYEIESDQIYPKALINEELEENYIGLLLNDPKSISMYYFLFEVLSILKKSLDILSSKYPSMTPLAKYSFSKAINDKNFKS